MRPVFKAAFFAMLPVALFNLFSLNAKHLPFLGNYVSQAMREPVLALIAIVGLILGILLPSAITAFILEFLYYRVPGSRAVKTVGTATLVGILAFILTANVVSLMAYAIAGLLFHVLNNTFNPEQSPA